MRIEDANLIGFYFRGPGFLAAWSDAAAAASLSSDNIASAGGRPKRRLAPHYTAFQYGVAMPLPRSASTRRRRTSSNFSISAGSARA